MSRKCDLIGALMSSATQIEASTWKPGNTSLEQIARGVPLSELLTAAAITRRYYSLACKGVKPTFSNLRVAVSEALARGLKYAIFGTALTLLPMAASKVEDPSQLREVTETLRTMGEDEARDFLRALELVSPSYLGRMKRQDYREYSGTLWDLLVASSPFDSVSRNLTSGYKYTEMAYAEIANSRNLEEGTLRAFLRVLAAVPDGLIYRRHGGRVAMWVSERASELFSSGTEQELESFNQTLLERGWNPGSTADVVASGIYLYLVSSK
ncbi:hypothetical protein HS1genome_0814 [Sulfodiicoccus acidiphilus]|uniref:Triphosphoribosyl-dephospho-CoA synthase n=1 Tax=Sulfodiicoccus acidiphilus TaxID=1670455 RepID=A0A348B2M3_9CREN|nr:triphosphoribosyl-dephospho-CoA synthase [Sulfodiicoccus acidiphilus]BBD72425.1 hypothetical protein HS1genome_0814 [Sulfodiicoccus acidiphilus]GGT97217.1 hypothetical protein GCM10007116_13420 [Sulfodiicoccus acidiphilus]